MIRFEDFRCLIESSLTRYEGMKCSTGHTTRVEARIPALSVV